MSQGQTEVKAQCPKFRPGGIFSALSETAAAVAKDTMRAAKAHRTIASYDLNYRQPLWKSFGGRKRAPEVNRELVFHLDTLFGDEEDFTAASGNQAIDQGQRIWFRDHVGPQRGA